MFTQPFLTLPVAAPPYTSLSLPLLGMIISDCIGPCIGQFLASFEVAVLLNVDTSERKVFKKFLVHNVSPRSKSLGFWCSALRILPLVECLY